MEKVLNVTMAILMAGIAIISGWLAAEQPNDDD